MLLNIGFYLEYNITVELLTIITMTKTFQSGTYSILIHVGIMIYDILF